MASAGPNYPGTAATGADQVFFQWTGTANLAASDDTYASAVGTGALDSLVVSNFGFAIPAAATIDGIIVEYERKAGAAFSVLSQTAFYNGGKLLKAGSPVGTAKTDGNWWATTDETITLGSSSDLWGATWTDGDINNSGFGFKLAVGTGGKSGQTAYIDYIRITVHYTAGGGGSSPLFQTRPVSIQPILAR